jgi:HSP20 family protein
MISRFERDFDGLFREFGNGEGVAFAPSVDIREEEGQFVLQADLPGMEQEAIQVKVENETLILTGKREETSEQEQDGRHYRERRFGSFMRSFRLGSGVDAGAIEARYDKGVLTVTIPKKEQLKPRQIPVATN